ncbi:MAG TPA: hypothetical protein VGO92_08080 [Acidimicrobiales bacterium]|nr:hypothetical protein [Acidimicrobiales bacterium]
MTSARGDGTWTWRAAGAKQPKGVLDGTLLYAGAKVGDVVKADAEFEIDGITVIAVLPPKGAVRKEPERIEVIGTKRAEPGVTSSLVPKSGRDRRDRPERGDRPPRRDRPERGERGAGGFGGPGGSGGPGGPGGSGGDRRPPRSDRPERGPRPERADRPDRPRGDRPERGPRPERAERSDRPAPPKPKRLSPANVHRAAVLDSLPPEHRPIAEQVLRGGIPAVRQAVDQQNAGRKDQGEPEVKADPFIAIAEALLPRLKAADWRDRAEAAVKDVDEIALRDLRSVVTGADAVARDDESRELARQLREALERRVGKQREEWVTEITTNLDEGRVVRALRLSGRPPDPGGRFPAELALRLTESAGAALSPEISPDRWVTVLDAVASSPVRRTVKPAGLPAEPGEALLQAAKQASGRVPALAAMLGIDMPPPPGPPRGAPPRPPRPPRPSKPRPPKPPAAASADAAAAELVVAPPTPAVDEAAPVAEPETVVAPEAFDAPAAAPVTPALALQAKPEPAAPGASEAPAESAQAGPEPAAQGTGEAPAESAQAEARPPSAPEQPAEAAPEA